MRKVFVILAMALVLCGAFAMSAQALITMDFSIPAPQLNPPIAAGTGTYAGGASPFVGTDIPVASVVGPNGQSFPVINGLLNFETGNFVSAVGGELEFAPGGNFVLSGKVGPADGDLVSGSFVLAPNGQGPELEPAVGGVVHFTASLSDTKLQALLDFLNVTGPNAFLGTIVMGFQGDFPGAIPGTTPLGLTSLSGDVTNTQVPVPPTALLLGSGLLGLVGFRLRRKA